MRKMVTYDKMGKKQRKEVNKKSRLTWGIINPCTRSIPSGKTYNRAKFKRGEM